MTIDRLRISASSGDKSATRQTVLNTVFGAATRVPRWLVHD